MTSKRRKQLISLTTLLLFLPVVAITVVLTQNSQDTRSDASEPKGKITLLPQTVDQEVNTEFTINIIPDPDATNNGSAIAIDTILQFDPDILEAVEVIKGDTAGTYPFQDKDFQINNTTGLVKVSWLAYDELASSMLPPLTAPTPIGSVRFRLLSNSGTVIETVFNAQDATQDSNIILSDNSETVDILSSKNTVTVNGGGVLPPVVDDGGIDPPVNDENNVPPVDDGNIDPPIIDDDDGETGDDDTILPGDIDLDGKIDLADYSLFVDDYVACKKGATCNDRSDINNDGKVNLSDYSLFIDQYKSKR